MTGDKAKIMRDIALAKFNISVESIKKLVVEVEREIDLCEAYDLLQELEKEVRHAKEHCSDFIDYNDAV